MGNWFQCCFLSVTWEHNESWNTRQMEVAYVYLVARWDQKKKKKTGWQPTHARAHTQTRTDTQTQTDTRGEKKQKNKRCQYFTPCICQLWARFFAKTNVHASKLSSAPYAHCESVVQNTKGGGPHQPPPTPPASNPHPPSPPGVKSQNIDWMIQLFKVVRLRLLFFHIFFFFFFINTRRRRRLRLTCPPTPPTPTPPPVFLRLK